MQTEQNEKFSKKPPVTPSSIGNYLLDKLHEKGVRHIFGIPGDYILKFNKLIEEHPHIEFIGTTRENTAGHMADAYARMQGLGVACITYGVGISIVNSTAQAYVESVPTIVISGAASDSEFRRSRRLHHLINTSVTGERDTTQLEIFKNITIGQTILDDPETAAEEIDRIIDLCLEMKKPVYIELPRDMIEAPIANHPAIFHNIHMGKSHLFEKEIQKILHASRQPVIWIGHEISRFHLSDSVLAFAEKFHIPIVSSLLGKTTVSEHHPLFLGVYNGELSSAHLLDYLKDTDCIFILGVILSDIETGIFTAKIDQTHQIIASKAEISIDKKSHHNYCFEEFIAGLQHIPCDAPFRNPAKFVREKVSFLPEREKKITSPRTFTCIESHLQPGNIVVTDIGDSLFGASNFVLDKNCFIACPYYASIGFSIPAAIAVQLAKPAQRVVCIVGDGAFQITCTELSTAIRYGISPILILLNNHGYGTERPILDGTYNDVGNWDYTALTKVFKGGVGYKITTEQELDEALTKAFSDPQQLYLIEVELGQTDFSIGLQRFMQLVTG